VETNRVQRRLCFAGLSTVNAVRFQELAALFSDVPRVPPKVQATVLWSPDDLEVLVDLLVTITQDMQQKGTSSLVGTVASKLGTCRCWMTGWW
jgi:hypothetical protein